MLKFKIINIRCISHLKSQNDMLKQKINRLCKEKPINRFSPYDERTPDLISFVKNKEYEKALRLVNNNNLHPDAHSYWENTVLTDCAKRGDIDGTIFCLKQLNASPFVSCHCPDHRSAFHYASMEGHIEILKILYDHVGNTNDSNLLTSSGKTPLDVAKNDKTKIFMISYKTKTKNTLTYEDILKLQAPNN
jgi:hypothetical protein